jgi:capsid protein
MGYFRGLLDALVGRRQPAAISARSWQAAFTDRLNEADWDRVTGNPINADLYTDQTNLRQRSEHEAKRNPTLEGIINTHSMDVIGPNGPTFNCHSSDERYNEDLEQVWQEWWQAPACNTQLSGVDLLFLHWRNLWLGGEYCYQLVSDPRAAGPVKTRILPIHTHRLQTPPYLMADPDVAMGVRRDKNRNPLQYYVLQPIFYGPWEIYTGKFAEIPARDFVHRFVMIEEDQVRGVPWFAPCLQDAANLRDYDAQVLDAMRSAADYAVYWKTNHPDSPFLMVNETTELKRRCNRFGPPGYEPVQMQPQQPGPHAETVRTAYLRRHGRGVSMPLMMIELDSSKHSFISARFDAQTYYRTCQRYQRWGEPELNRLVNLVAREAELAGRVPPRPKDAHYAWGWIKPPAVDPLKERMAERTGLENGTLAYADACAANGDDEDDVIARRKRSQEKLHDAGLPTIPGIPSRLSDAGAAEEDDEDSAADKPAGKAAAKQNAKPPIPNGNGKARFFHAPT